MLVGITCFAPGVWVANRLVLLGLEAAAVLRAACRVSARSCRGLPLFGSFGGDRVSARFSPACSPLPPLEQSSLLRLTVAELRAACRASARSCRALSNFGDRILESRSLLQVRSVPLCSLFCAEVFAPCSLAFLVARPICLSQPFRRLFLSATPGSSSLVPGVVFSVCVSPPSPLH